jgi:hypothetical protein
MEKRAENLDLDQIHTKLLNLGLILDVFIPAVLFSLGLFLRNQGVGVEPVEGLDILLWVLLAVSAGEILTIYLMKRKFLFPRNVPMSEKENISLEQIFFRSGLILFSLSLSPAIYGFIYFLLGGMTERFVIFIGITLLCFVLFKPKLEEMKSMMEGSSNLLDGY